MIKTTTTTRQSDYKSGATDVPNSDRCKTGLPVDIYAHLADLIKYLHPLRRVHVIELPKNLLKK